MITAILIVAAILALGVGIVLWATRRRPHLVEPRPIQRDIAANDPPSPELTAAPVEPVDPFAGVPLPQEHRENRA
ncbi:hypothetical protein [Brevundimonas sp.]|jgi:hypothetical protein|uniref:hypothetical protein n=1 Tax=Brevundimonas sp. TaxID=1871086 RepID=UPI0037C062AF